jgi:hypothetical protein
MAAGNPCKSERNYLGPHVSGGTRVDGLNPRSYSPIVAFGRLRPRIRSFCRALSSGCAHVLSGSDSRRTFFDWSRGLSSHCRCSASCASSAHGSAVLLGAPHAITPPAGRPSSTSRSICLVSATCCGPNGHARRSARLRNLDCQPFLVRAQRSRHLPHRTASSRTATALSAPLLILAVKLR